MKTLLKHSKPPPVTQILLGAFLVSLGVGLAFWLFQLESDGQVFFRFALSQYLPLAVWISAAYSAILALWVLYSWGKLPGRHMRNALGSISLIALGFGYGLLGTAIPGLGNHDQRSFADSYFAPQNQIHPLKLNFYSGDKVTIIITNPNDFTGLVVEEITNKNKKLEGAEKKFIQLKDLEIIAEVGPNSAAARILANVHQQQRFPFFGISREPSWSAQTLQVSTQD